MVVRDIIEAARYRLGDLDKTGWSNDRLVKLVDDGQKDICKTTSIYRRITYIPLANNQTLYSLPRDCYDVKRIEYGGKQLPIFSREDIDSLVSTSEAFAIKSNLNRGLIEIYPERNDLEIFEQYIVGTMLQSGTIEVEPFLGAATHSDSSKVIFDTELGVVSSIYEDISCNQFTNFGGIAGSNLDLQLVTQDDSDLGVLVAIGFKAGSENYGFFDHMNNIYSQGTYGITTDVTFPDYFVTVYYTAQPPTTEFYDSSLVLDSIWEKALVHYVVAMARQDDNDEGNYQLGEAELKKYELEVAKALKISAKNFTSQMAGERHTIYRGFNKYSGGFHGSKYSFDQSDY